MPVRSFRWQAGLAALTFVVGFGCQSIGGIDDLEIVDCVGDCGVADASLDTSVTEAAVDSGADVVDSTVAPDASDSGADSGADAALDADADASDADASDAADTSVVDTGPPDTGPLDTGPKDTGPVDTGPVDTGCTATSCPSNQRCVAGVCALCGVDSACGPSCLACPSTTPKCLALAASSSCVQCLVKADCPSGQTCTLNACVPEACALPANACDATVDTGSSCANASVIGRSLAKNATGYTVTTTSCGASDGNNTDCASDDGFDRSYRIFLRKGEKISVNYNGSAGTCGGSNSTRLKINQNSNGCGTPTAVACNPSSTVCTSLSSTTYVAPAEGWFTIVADSTKAGAGLESYTLTVKLDPTTCAVSGCECP